MLIIDAYTVEDFLFYDNIANRTGLSREVSALLPLLPLSLLLLSHSTFSFYSYLLFSPFFSPFVPPLSFILSLIMIIILHTHKIIDAINGDIQRVFTAVPVRGSDLFVKIINNDSILPTGCKRYLIFTYLLLLLLF